MTKYQRFQRKLKKITENGHYKNYFFNHFLEQLEDLFNEEYFDILYNSVAFWDFGNARDYCRFILLNGAYDWEKYSFDGNCLIYNEDLKRILNVNCDDGEKLLHIQARELAKAADAINRMIIGLMIALY